MTSAQEVLGIAAELFIWLGLGGAALCFLILLFVRAFQGKSVSSEGVLAESEDGTQLRWLADDGLLRSRPLTEAERAEIGDPDELLVYYRRHSPDTVDLQPVDHAEGVLRMLGLILLGVGVLAFLVSFVALLLP
ncbi:hypothetical protein ACX3O0_08840 [Homoserinimonas sp. A447]